MGNWDLHSIGSAFHPSVVEDDEPVDYYPTFVNVRTVAINAQWLIKPYKTRHSMRSVS